jgi:putative addiction module antidote
MTHVITKVAMHTLKLTQVGNSVGAIFPKELLARLQLEKGDVLYVTETPDGLRITTHNPEFEAQMRVAREIMKERRAVLRELAK